VRLHRLRLSLHGHGVGQSVLVDELELARVATNPTITALNTMILINTRGELSSSYQGCLAVGVLTIASLEQEKAIVLALAASTSASSIDETPLIIKMRL
jgi:hypothetical protein